MELAGLKALGLNTDDGLAYCADDPEFYAEMLEEYITEAPDTAAVLEGALAAADLELYGVRVHALKSSSRIIGAADIAERAYELETAAKNNDAEKIRSRHAGFIADYLELTERIWKDLRPEKR